MVRRKRHEDHENHERWLISYADFITLLFAFFVVMYSISTLNEGKYRVLADSLVGIFNAPERSTEQIPIGDNPVRSDVKLIPAELVSEINPDPLLTIARSMRETFGDLIGNELLNISGNETWLEIELNSSLLFSSGDAIPNENAFSLIEKVALILAPYTNPIRVEGFTDNQPINTARYPTNWELSAARAASVVRMLASHGVDPARLAAVGYGEYRPVADNSSARGRARNRRVVLAIARDAQTYREPAGLPTAQPASVERVPSDGSGPVRERGASEAPAKL